MLKIEFQLAIVTNFLFGMFEEFPQIVIDKQRAAQDAHDFEYGSVQLEIVLDNGNETVCDDGDVDLYPHGVFGIAPKTFDTQMLLDPFEEQLHLPAVAVKQSDVLGFEVEVVGVVNERASEVSDIEHNAPEFRGVVVSVSFAGESDSLVGKHTVCPIKKFLSKKHLVGGMPFLSYDEKRVGLVNGEKSRKIEIAPVEHIAGKRLIYNAIHELGVMDIGVCDAVENRNLGDDINLGVNLDTGLSAAEVRPKEKRHAKVDGCGVDSKETPMQFKVLGDAPLLRKRDHVVGEFLEHKRVTEHIRVGKSAPADRRFAKPEKVASFSMCSDYIGEFPETSTPYQLPEHEHQQVIPVREVPLLCLGEMFFDYPSELPLRQKICDLCENILPHKRLCTDFGSAAKMQISNPGQGISYLTYCA